jgi:hypothetical protein
MTLTKLIPNGSQVKQGDLIAVFGNTQQADMARDISPSLRTWPSGGTEAGPEPRRRREAYFDLGQAEADLAGGNRDQKGPVLAGSTA